MSSLTRPIGPLKDSVTWYGINYPGTQITQWDFQNKGTRTSPARLFFVLKVPLRYLRPSKIYSVPCDRILQGPITEESIESASLLRSFTHLHLQKISKKYTNKLSGAFSRENISTAGFFGFFVIQSGSSTSEVT